ncbi:MAG: InlB B-repeat-containing protein [Bacteroidales bacterium]|nr:InlB B-repeat-containing protein [Bacteroidales bacterium]
MSQQLSVNTFTRDGYTFIGWNTKADGSGTSYTDKHVVSLTEDITLYAQWKQRIFYSVTFKANGGIGTMADQVFEAGVSQALVSNAFTHENETFIGWNTAPDGSGTSYTDKQVVSLTEDLTLYAQWKAKTSFSNITSTVCELSPITFVEETADQSWVFQNGISVKVDKFYVSVDAYTDGTETAPYAMLKVPKDKAGTITIPSNLGVVKVAFYGVSNSSYLLNWAYLQMFANTVEFPIMTPEERDIKDNEAIQKLQYPISPMVSSLAQPFATFTAEKGTAWFEELNFEFDGNNHVAINIVLWTVSENEVEAWDPATDDNINAVLSSINDDK